METPPLSVDWKEIVPELTTEQNRILLIQMNHPVVIQYFQRLALDAMSQNAMRAITPDNKAVDDRTLIAEAAYMRGKIEVASGIIDSVIEYQKVISPKKLTPN